MPPTMASMSARYTARVAAPASLSSQPWWPQLNAVINESYSNKDHSVFPPTWARLDPDPIQGAKGLADELGARGMFVVIFDERASPVACSGTLPFRGDNWINEAFKKSDTELAGGTVHGTSEGAAPSASSTAIPDWETCCFCVHPSQRGQGLAYRLVDELIAVIKTKGAERLISNYSIDETGPFWRKLGFEVIPGAGGMLPKGFQKTRAKEGLRADIHFGMGAKVF